MGGYYLPGGATTASLTVYNASWDSYLEDRAATVGGDVNTTDDMTKLFQWQYGDVLYGTQAKSSPTMAEYIKDIEEAWGREDEYESNKIYVDTFKPDVGKRYKQGGDQ